MSTNSLLAAERARLEEERLAAIIEGIELDLELGRHGELLGQLEALVIAHPFKERLVELQMLALYRSGRQADALAAFQAARGRFVDELGIEPAQPLRELHEDVLKHSAELSSPVDTTAETTVEAQPRPATPSALSDRRLPVPPNRTIGREHELAAVGERLRAGSVRLLTLTGPGGVGKTRLALEAARAVQADFADGAHFVSLAALQRPEDVPAAIVEALGIIVLSGESADQAAERFLAAKHLLLVADNFEHLLAAAPFIGGLLEACPALTVLATSREPLALQAEERYPVSPLALPEPGTPEDPQALAGADAVALFCERARAHDPDFDLSEATPPRSRRSAGASTGCRWRSSSRPPAADCCRRPRSPSAWTPRSARWAPARATRPPASRRCARRSTGATSCSATPRSSASRASRCSPAARPSRRPRRSPAPASTRSTAWSPRACSCAASTRTRPPGWGCSRRSAPTPPSASRPPPTARPSASATTATTSRSPSATEPTRRSAARVAQEHLARLDAEIDNLHAALAGRSAPDAERALAMARRSAGTG